ncbi:hypothetical protein IGI04_041628, partial [Brassica rapa subsp. trilocularis]
HEVDDDKRYDARQVCKREHTLVVYPEFGLIRGTYISGGRQATNPLDQEVFIHSKAPGAFAPFGALSSTLVLFFSGTLNSDLFSLLLYCWSLNLKQQLTIVRANPCYHNLS